MIFNYMLDYHDFQLLATLLCEYTGSHKPTTMQGFVEYEILAGIRNNVVLRALTKKKKYRVSWKTYEAIVYWYLMNRFIRDRSCPGIQTMNNRIHHDILINSSFEITEGVQHGKA